MAKYEEDELVDNLDDEKHLFRAEVRAGRKIEQKSAKESKKKGGPEKKFYMTLPWVSPSPWSGERAQSTWRCHCFQPCRWHTMVSFPVC